MEENSPSIAKITMIRPDVTVDPDQILVLVMMLWCGNILYNLGLII